MKSCISCRCIWLCFKALSGGVLLIAIGVGMTVFGFYADTFAVQEQLDEETNTTVHVVNEHLKLHLHNLTYVGPVIMGLGGMMIVAACVLIDAQEDADTRARNRRPSDAEEQLIAKAEPCNGPFFSLDLPPAKVPDKGGGQEVVTVAEVVALPNGPNTPRPALPLPVSPATETGSSSLSSPPPRVAVRQKKRFRKSSSTFSFLSPLFDVPSPQDIQILDPDGCTPDSLEMEVLHSVTKCHPPRLQLEPRYLASIESDGLSDSDTAETEFSAGSSLKGRFCSEGQDMPLLGRCSPPSSPEYPMEPLLKRDRTGLRRFQLMRQVPHNARTLFDGPSSEGGSR
ncbi:uncharacterized protein CDAR_31971 [Caerostris darwini]|uniref:Transmembrane protein 200B n=1 Tax=Caerostris darwini TaxID=1538125 RepID=A0AAV4RS92_9ARAC|nr:uncharacterized protein CDAR_31971 [Caerostris darwini]